MRLSWQKEDGERLTSDNVGDWVKANSCFEIQEVPGAREQMAGEEEKIRKGTLRSEASSESRY